MKIHRTVAQTSGNEKGGRIKMIRVATHGAVGDGSESERQCEVRRVGTQTLRAADETQHPKLRNTRTRAVLNTHKRFFRSLEWT